MKVAIVMGSKSDYPVVEKAEAMLREFGVEYETRIISAHRTPKQAEEFAANAEANGFGTIIAAAGKAAHLAGVLAATTPLPVIGLPMKSSTMDGLDSHRSHKRSRKRCDPGSTDPGGRRTGPSPENQGFQEKTGRRNHRVRPRISKPEIKKQIKYGNEK